MDKNNNDTTVEQRHEAIKNAYVVHAIKEIYIINPKTPEAVKTKLLQIQEALGVGFDASYEIMAQACDIIADKTIAGDVSRDSLTGEDLDFWADADSVADVYTGVRLSYLNNYNEAEISALMKDEAIESIAQACSIWHSQKVAEGCEALKDYILTGN